MSFSPILIYNAVHDFYFVGSPSDICCNCADVTHDLEHVQAAKRSGIDMPYEKTEQGKQASIDKVEFQRRIVAADAWQTCINCDNWCNGDPAHTRQIGAPDGWQGCIPRKAFPPVETLVHGCSEHIFTIPF